MNKSSIWMVRAGQGAVFADDFIENGLVAIGWNEIGDLSPGTKKPEIEVRLATAFPEVGKGSNAVSASQLKRYYGEIQVGDVVATYDSNQRLYFLGEIISGVERREHFLGRSRKVKWTHQVGRDLLGKTTRNSLGSIATLFLIKSEAAEEMWSHAVAIGASPPEGGVISTRTAGPPEDDEVIIQEVAAKADEFIEDRIAKLSWEQMEELVKEILIGMGYRARVSAKGADRGVDVFASPDGLGLQEPRIFVEVKHRPGTSISADQVRAFLGGRQPGDRCLYVSTGGFTKDSRYEAERSSIPITLIALPQLRELVVENYEAFTSSGKALLPLERIYWPVS